MSKIQQMKRRRAELMRALNEIERKAQSAAAKVRKEEGDGLREQIKALDREVQAEIEWQLAARAARAPDLPGAWYWKGPGHAVLDQNWATGENGCEVYAEDGRLVIEGEDEEFCQGADPRVVLAVLAAHGVRMPERKRKPITSDPPTYDPEGNVRSKRLKLDPDLADGAAATVHACADRGLAEILRAWMEDASAGESVTLEIVELSDAEADALPEI